MNGHERSRFFFPPHLFFWDESTTFFFPRRQTTQSSKAKADINTTRSCFQHNKTALDHRVHSCCGCRIDLIESSERICSRSKSWPHHEAWP